MSTHAGFPDPPYGAVPYATPGTHDVRDGRSWLIAYHAGEYPADPGGRSSRPVSEHRLMVESVRLQSDAPLVHAGADYTPPAIRQLNPDAQHRASGSAPAPRARPSPRAVVGGQAYDALYGDLHRHSAYSKCMPANDGTPLDHWRWATDVAGLDFYAVTEHLEFMSHVEWRRVEDLAAALASGGQMLALGGFETTRSPGHANFIYADHAIGTDLRSAFLVSPDLGAVWSQLDRWLAPEAVEQMAVIRHHQGHAGEGLEHYSAKYEPAVEVIQIRWEHPKWARALWREGYRLGVVGSSDHARRVPFVQALAGVWLPENTRSRAAVLAGIRARRTFATNGTRTSAFLWAENVLPDGRGGGEDGVVRMGEAATARGAPRLVAAVTGTRTIEFVSFYRDELLVHTHAVNALEATVVFEDEAAAPGEHAYSARVLQEPETQSTPPSYGVAYSSAVWITVT